MDEKQNSDVADVQPEFSGCVLWCDREQIPFDVPTTDGWCCGCEQDVALLWVADGRWHCAVCGKTAVKVRND